MIFYDSSRNYKKYLHTAGAMGIFFQSLFLAIHKFELFVTVSVFTMVILLLIGYRFVLKKQMVINEDFLNLVTIKKQYTFRWEDIKNIYIIKNKKQLVIINKFEQKTIFSRMMLNNQMLWILQNFSYKYNFLVTNINNRKNEKQKLTK